jgi:hypothetical protein
MHIYCHRFSRKSTIGTKNLSRAILPLKPRPAHNDVERDPLYYIIPSTRFSASSNYITTCRVVRVFITSAERQPRGVGKNKQLLEHLLPKGLDSMAVYM